MGLSPTEFATLLAQMPQDMAAKACAQALKVGGAAAEAVEIFEAATPEAITLAEEAAAAAALVTPGRWWMWGLKIAGIFGLEKIAEKVIATGFTSGFAELAGLWPNVTGQMAFAAYEKLDSYTPIGLNLTGRIYEHIFPGSMNADDLAAAYNVWPLPANDPKSEDDFFGVLGANTQVLFNYMFDVPGVIHDYADRTGDASSYKNFRRVMGANLSMQIRAQTMAVVSQLFPLGPLRHIGELHTHLVNAMGLNRLAHTMLSVLAHNLIHGGLQRDLQRRIKPHDLTTEQATRAFVEKHLPPDDFRHILDNNGVRDDIRDILIDQHTHKLSRAQIVECYLSGRISKELYQTWMTDQGMDVAAQDFLPQISEPTLSPAQLEHLYQTGQVDRAYLVQQFRYKSFSQARAEQQADLIVRARSEDLTEKITTSMQRLYRDCVITEAELRQWLTTAHYTAPEQDLVVQWQQAEVRQRTFMSVHDMFKAVEIGVMDLEDVLTSLQCRGYTAEDALAEAIVKLQEKAPECGSTKLEQKALIALLQKLASTWGVTPGLLKPAILKYILCLGQVPPIILPTATLKCEPQPLLGPGWIKLSWETLLATHAEINHGVGPVPTSGHLDLKVTSSRGYELTASNPLGKTVAFTWVQIDHEPPA